MKEINRQNKLDMTNPETMKLLMDYMKNKMGKNGDPQNATLNIIFKNIENVQKKN